MTPAPKQILVVEDQRIVAADIENTLARLGYAVIGTASSGEEAIQKVSHLRPDLVLMDIRLQGEMDGIQAAQIIRDRFNLLPVVYLTAYADEETIRRAKLTAPFGYVVKPFNERELHSAVEIALYKEETERLLRTREQWLSTILRSIGDAVITVDSAGAVSFLNPAAEALTGWSFPEAKGRPLSEIGRIESAAGHELTPALLEQAIRPGGASVPEDACLVSRDQRRIPVNGNATAIVDAQERAGGSVLVLGDATARKQSEEARLRLAEEEARRRTAEEERKRFHLLIEGVKDYAILMLDPEGHVASWNAGAEEIAGYRAEEIVGKHFSVFYPSEDVARGKPTHELQRAIAQGRVEDEGWRVRKDGSCFWGNVVIAPMRDEDGGLQGFSKVTRDLSHRKNLEDAERLLDQVTMTLASSLDISDTLQRASRLAVPGLGDWCLIDLAEEGGRLAQAAAAHVDTQKEELARLLGRGPPSETEPGRGAWHVFRTGKTEIYPELTDPVWAAALLGTEHPELLRELGVRSYMCVPIQGRGRTLGVLSLLRAMPPRRYSAGDLSLSEELARRAGMAIDNARYFREAQEAIRARDEFLAIASHELKTPLTPLQLQLDTLHRALEKAGVQDERLDDMLERASRQTVRLIRLVGSLLDVSRITAGRLAIEPEEFDLSEMVRETVERFGAEAGKAGCTLEFRAGPPLVGRWDRTRLEQVVSNFLSNAIKYGAGRTVEIDVRESDGTVRLTVIDHGIGIENEALSRIFDRFGRAASLRQYGGLGLGLYIARRIVEGHGGSILARSQLGMGSTFIAVLPRQTAVSHRVDEKPRPEST